jgi:hypothetical protein
MEAEEAGPALRLWRALARRCVGPYGEHAAAPLTLAGWVAWSAGDEIEAREALAMALGADPSYLFARLLHQACNEGLDPESIRRCLRAEREGREGRDTCVRPEAVQSVDAKATEDMTRPNPPCSDGSQASSPPGSDGVMELPGDPLAVFPPRAEGVLPTGPSGTEDAVSPCRPGAEEAALPPCPSGAGALLPTPPPTTTSRRRKRVRPSARADARSQLENEAGRQPCAEETRPRSRSARGTRPGAVRRATGKDDARRLEGTGPVGGPTEEEG